MNKISTHDLYLIAAIMYRDIAVYVDEHNTDDTDMMQRNSRKEAKTNENCRLSSQ